MSLIGNIIRSYHRPQVVVAQFVANGAREDRALGFLTGGCVIAFIAQWPRLARQSFIEGQALDMLIGGALYAWIFLAPLMFYILAGLVQFIGYLMGSKRSGAQTRTAIFWAFLIFLLNFIPTIGSLLATLFPVIFSLLQFGDFSIALIILFVVGSIQVIIGNFIEPKWMGNSMNISPLVSILSLMFWGLIWGTTGMIVSVPFTVVIIIILSEIEYTRPLAILLSEKGDINDRE